MLLRAKSFHTFVNCFAINNAEEVSMIIFMGHEGYRTVLFTVLGASR